jgi:hypothetical protein
MGMRTSKRAPAGASVTTSIAPPNSSTRIRRATKRPSPVPAPAGLVVKNGSKIRARMAVPTPRPLS